MKKKRWPMFCTIMMFVSVLMANPVCSLAAEAEVHYTMREVMQRAGINTLIGMGVVFAVLIFISFIISLFKYIHVFQEKMRRGSEDKKRQKSLSQAEKEMVLPAGEEEILAVIAAVIREELGKSYSRKSEESKVRKYNIKLNGKTYEVEIEEVGRGNMRSAPLAAVRRTPGEAPAPAPAPAPTPEPNPAPIPAPAAPAKEAPASAATSSEGSTPVNAGITGKVFKIETTVGQTVKSGDTLIILEAMKMEIPVVAPADGTVASIAVAVGDPVEAGQLLVTLG